MNLKGKNVLLVGSSGKIAEAFIDELRKNDCRLTLTTSRKDSSEKSTFLDLNDSFSIKEFLENSTIDFDGVIINSGVAYPESFEKKTEEEISNEIRINLLGPAILLNKLVSSFKKNNGFVILNSSLNAVFFTPGMNSYCASKAGLMALGESLRYELRGSGVQVLILLTPPIKSGMAIEGEGKLNKYLKKRLDQKLLDPNTYVKWVIKNLKNKKEGVLVHPSTLPIIFLNRIYPGIQKKIFSRLFSF